eukprot:1187597-Prorocentrum_minimum.AAC.3
MACSARFFVKSAKQVPACTRPARPAPPPARREYSQSLSFYWSPEGNILSQCRSIGHPQGIFLGIVVLLVAHREYSTSSAALAGSNRFIPKTCSD